MSTHMTWPKLLNNDRYVSSGRPISAVTKTSSTISVFQEDNERILYSSPFRRLQGKTQVYPFPIVDYLRTRLTHTVEVSHIGRIISTEASRTLLRKNINGIDAISIADVVAAACLAHDIGNPPFGHIGEYAIRTWFDNSSLPAVREIMSDSSLRWDFANFDGNAQGFRILTRLAGWRYNGGLRLSYATLGAFTKYPFGSSQNTAKAKFGYFHDDKEAAKEVFAQLGMQDGDLFRRHPLAFIVEAADDIAYLTTDIEDSCRVDVIKFETGEELLKSIADSGGHMDNYNTLRGSAPRDRMAYLRAATVRELVDTAIDSFVENHEALMAGRLSGSLLTNSRYAKQTAAIRRTCEKFVYQEAKKALLEAAGYSVITTLLDVFGAMIQEYVDKSGAEKLNPRNLGLFNILPEEFQENLKDKDPYRSFLVLVDYISGMTDRYILDLHQRIFGSSISLGR